MQRISRQPETVPSTALLNWLRNGMRSSSYDVVESSAVRPWGIDQRMRNAETEMDRLVRSARQTCKIMRHTLIGDPADRALAHAPHRLRFSVAGPAHGKIVGEKLLGSTAARIVRRATVPVLAVKRRPEAPYRSIVSAVDFSDASRSALLGGRTLFPSAQFTALHAYHTVPNWSGRNAERSIDVVEAEERERVVKEAERNMDDLVAGAGTPAIETAIMEGEPEVVLADYVARNWPDLVVAGSTAAARSSTIPLAAWPSAFSRRFHAMSLPFRHGSEG